MPAAAVPVAARERVIDRVPEEAAAWALWAPDVASATEHLLVFAKQFEEPGDGAHLDALKRWYALDTNSLLDPGIVDQHAGLVVFGKSAQAPVIAVRVSDVQKADGILATRAHAVGPERTKQQVGGYEVSSLNFRHWVFVGNTLFVTRAGEGRAALDALLAAVPANASAPPASLANPNIFADADKTSPTAQWFAWAKGPPDNVTAIRFSQSGVDAHVVVKMATACQSAAVMPLAALVPRFDPNALIVAASRGRCTSPLSRESSRVYLAALENLLGADLTKEVTELSGAGTWQLGWSDLGTPGLSAEHLQVSSTLQVSDVTRAQNLLSNVVKKLQDSNIKVTRGEQRFNSKNLPVYRVDWNVAPLQHPMLPRGKGADNTLHVRFALAGNTLVATIGAHTFEAQKWLWDGSVPVTRPALPSELVAALDSDDGIGIMRPGLLGHLIYQWVGTERAHAGTNIYLRAARALERLGECYWTMRHDARATDFDFSCRLSDRVDPIPPTQSFPPSAADGARTSKGPIMVTLFDDKDLIVPRKRVRDTGCSQESRLKSENSAVPQIVLFQNKSRQPVTLMWLDYQGKRVSYGTLRPGQIIPQSTFLTHPWVIVGEDKKCRTVVVPKDSAP